MCTYHTEMVSVDASAKAPDSSWASVSEIAVYYDHPVHVMADHSLNIDVRSDRFGPAGRIALELTAESARRLADAITSALTAAGTV